MSRHDAAYRKLFTHPRLVHDLLVGFVDQPWVRQLDFSTLVPVRTTFVTQQLEIFQADQAWQVVHRPSGRIVYVLLEFQSRVDRWMALRMVNYAVHLKFDRLQDPRVLQEGLTVIFPHGDLSWSKAMACRDRFSAPARRRARVAHGLCTELEICTAGYSRHAA